MNQRFCILIPAHNRRQVTLNCLKILMNKKGFEHFVVLIDDGSTDGTTECIRDTFPDVKILQGDGNLWWTGCILKGMKYAFLSGFEFFVWLNDDCFPNSEGLDLLIQKSIDNSSTIFGSACYLNETGALISTGARGRRRLSARPGEIIKVDEMSGHCVCVPRAVVNAIGFPDPTRFPHYHGDSSYILRATRAGFPAYILGDVKVNHLDKVKTLLKDFIDIKDHSLKTSFEALFLSKKSLYFVPTQFHYNIFKYGPVLGVGIFLVKFIWWIFGWANLLLSRSRS